MKRLTITLVCILLLFSTCKKTVTPAPTPHTPATVAAILTNGYGTWKIGTSLTYYYDKNNVILQVDTMPMVGFWSFVPGISRPEWGNVQYIADFTTQNYTYFPYAINVVDGKDYLTTGATLKKYQFVTLTNELMVISTSEISALTFIRNNQTLNADHATNVMTLTKYD